MGDRLVARRDGTAIRVNTVTRPLVDERTATWSAIIGWSDDVTASAPGRAATSSPRSPVEAAERERLHRERLEFLGAVNDALLALVDTPGADDERDPDCCAPARRLVLDPCAAVHGGIGARRRGRPRRSGDGRATPAELQDRFPYDPDAPTGVPRVIRTGAHGVPSGHHRRGGRRVRRSPTRSVTSSRSWRLRSTIAVAAAQARPHPRRVAVRRCRVRHVATRTTTSPLAATGRRPHRIEHREPPPVRATARDRPHAPAQPAARSAARRSRVSRWPSATGRPVRRTTSEVTSTTCFHCDPARPVGGRDRRRLRHRSRSGRVDRVGAALDTRQRLARRHSRRGACVRSTER